MAKVTIPTNTDDLLNLIKEIIDKHNADGAASLLPKDDADKLSDIYKVQAPKRADWHKVNKSQEDSTEKTKLALGIAKGQTVDTPGTAKFYVTKFRDLLSTLNKGNPKALGNWGFVVNENGSNGGKGKTPPTPPTPGPTN